MQSYKVHTFIIKSVGKFMTNHYTQCTILEVAGGRREWRRERGERKEGGRREEGGRKGERGKEGRRERGKVEEREGRRRDKNVQLILQNLTPSHVSYMCTWRTTEISLQYLSVFSMGMRRKTYSGHPAWKKGTFKIPSRKTVEKIKH